MNFEADTFSTLDDGYFTNFLLDDSNTQYDFLTGLYDTQEFLQKSFVVIYENECDKIPIVLNRLYQETGLTKEDFQSAIIDWFRTLFSSPLQLLLTDHSDDSTDIDQTVSSPLPLIDHSDDSTDIDQIVSSPLPLIDHSDDSTDIDQTVSSPLPLTDHSDDSTDIDQTVSTPLPLIDHSDDSTDIDQTVSSPLPLSKKRKLQENTIRLTKRLCVDKDIRKTGSKFDVFLMLEKLAVAGKELIEYEGKHTPQNELLTSTGTNGMSLSVDDLTYLNYQLGVQGAVSSLIGKICTRVHLMHIWYEVFFFGGGYDKSNISNGIKHVLSIIDNSSVSMEKIQMSQRMGRRLARMKRAFGWVILLIDDTSFYAIRDMSIQSFNELMAYLESFPIYDQIKTKIDESISVNLVKQKMIQIVSDVLCNVVSAEYLIDNIDIM